MSARLMDQIRESTRSTSAILILILALVPATAGASEADPYFEDFEAALQAGKERGLDVLIKFHENGCGWCDHIDTTVLSDKQAIQYFTNEMVLVKVPADVDTALADRYSVTTSPTLVLIRPTGEEIDRITKYMPTDLFLSTLRSYEKGIGTLDHLLQRAEGSNNRRLFMQIAEKYKLRGQIDESNRWYGRVVETGAPTDELSGEARIIIADAKRQAGAWDAALADFEAIEQDFQGHQYAATAALWQATIYRERGDLKGAIAEFERFIADYPASKDVPFAQKQIRELNDLPVANGK